MCFCDNTVQFWPPPGADAVLFCPGRRAVGRRRSPVFGDNVPTAVPSTHYPAVDYPVHVTETSKDKIDLETILAFILA